MFFRLVGFHDEVQFCQFQKTSLMSIVDIILFLMSLKVECHFI
jgi:hypothetical protein